MGRSKRLKTLFEIILCFGNYMNKGNRANASGFKISSLNKMIDTKSSRDKRITLLHYIITILEKKFPMVFNLEEELPDVRNASKVNPAELVKEIKSLRLGIVEIEKELVYQSSLKKKERLPNDRFVDAVSSFIKVASFSIQEIEDTHKEMEERLSKIYGFFGEDAKT